MPREDDLEVLADAALKIVSNILTAKHRPESPYSPREAMEEVGHVVDAFRLLHRLS